MPCRSNLTRAIAIALGAIALLAATSGNARASAFHRLDGNAKFFDTDGTRYAAWQYRPGFPIIVYDTATGHRGEIEDGCDLAGGAAAGRFLVDCREKTALLDFRTGVLTPLPETGAGWAEVGSRYVSSAYENGVRCRGMRRHEGCLVLYDIATRLVTKVPEARVPDLDRPGAPPVCPALRRRVLASERVGETEGGSYGDGVFVRSLALKPEGPSRWLRVERCHGHVTMLYSRIEPRSIDVSAGLLTWDTGHSENEDEEEGIKVRTGAITAYDLATHKRRSWALPALPLNSDGGEPNEPTSVGVFGSSTHTKTTLFWIADRTLSCSKAGCQPDTYYVYGARM